MQTTNFLFQLIKTLSKNEIASIKNEISTRPHLHKLFNALLVTEEYDEGKIIKQHPYITNTSYLRKLKSELGKIILKNISTENYSQQSSNNLIFSYLKASSLIERGFFLEAQTELNELRKQSKSIGLNGLTILANELLIIAESNLKLPTENYKKSADEISFEIDDSIKKIEAQFKLSFYSIRNFYDSYNKDRHTQQISELNSFLKNTKETKEKILCHYILANNYTSENSTKKVLVNILKAKDYALKNFILTQNTSELFYYILCSSTYLRIVSKYNLFSKKWDTAINELLELSDQLKSKNRQPYFSAIAKTTAQLNIAFYYFKTGRLKQLIDFCELNFKKQQERTLATNYIYLYKYVCLANIIMQNYHKAHFWINKVFELEKNVHPHFIIPAKMIYLALINESGPHDLELEIKRVNYFMEKSKLKHAPLKLFINALKNTNKNNTNSLKIKNEWMKLENNLATAPTHEISLSEDWLPFYVESKIKNLSFYDIYKKSINKK
ncbi:MAG: hypothetical protein J0M08_11580 [Bacteroidetes bacterium]|nr:hypothetical protein [Bacteroidota bacterium]